MICNNWNEGSNKIVREIDSDKISVGDFDRRARDVGETRACVIPKTPVMPKHFKDNWTPKSLRDMCSYEKRLTTIKDELKLVPAANLHENACFMEVMRGDNDAAYKRSKCFLLNSTYNLNNEESILIRNGTSYNAEVNFPVGPRVIEKWLHWKTKERAELPINVLLFGVDTTSRAHVYRSLPKTLEVMRRMKFIDFEGYHSVYPDTLSNFMAFLMGLTKDTVRNTCSPDWTAPFDSCPLIWKKFSEANYITMYMEDGSQSFNWGGQSGFIEQPTDYYWHHLFLELRRIRRNQFEELDISEGSTIDCASSESTGEFILRSTQRFINKFKDIPFFALSWLNDPFHDDTFALAGLDDSMSDFLTNLESKSEQVLLRTLIVFLSDHGDRGSSSMESFIERGSVPLFVRMPEALIQRYPQACANLKDNAHKLVSPFDIHQTLLQLLQPDFMGATARPTPDDERSSLFLPLDVTRTCAGSNIPVMNCLCNIEYDESDAGLNITIDSDIKLREKILRYGVRKLNEIVKGSGYDKECKKWRARKTDNISYVRKIGQTKEKLEIIAGFSVLDEQATFDIRFRLDLNQVMRIQGKIDDAVDFIGLERSSEYDDQSWCVRSVTDQDKKMKKFCYCKRKKPRRRYTDYFS